MFGFQFFQKSGVILLCLLGATVVLSGCSGSTPAVPSATPELISPAGEKKSARTGPVTISQVITNNGQPVGLQLGEREILRFTTPGSKLYTDALAFQSAVSEGLGGFLITPNAPSWISSCETAGTLPADVSMEQTELFAPHWQACRIGEQWIALSTIEKSTNREALQVWLAVPAQSKWESELQQIEWSLELSIR